MSVKSFKTSGVGVDLAPKGLVLINTTSFSGVASQSPGIVFSSTYTNYLIVMKYSCSSNANVRIKMRATSTDDSTNYFYAATGYATNNTNTTVVQSSGTAGFDICSNAAKGDNTNNFVVFELGSPFEATRTMMNLQSSTWINGDLLQLNNIAGMHSTASSFNSYNIIPSAGNITGTMATYGYNL
jgi:hypothetical protein